MAGRLHGTLSKDRVSGRPVEIRAEGRLVTVRFESLRDAFALRSAFASTLRPAVDVAARLDLDLQVDAGGRFKALVLPKPSLVARLAAPWLTRRATT